MKKLFILFFALVSLTIFIQAEINWAGNVYPNDGATFSDTFYVYFQIYKDGITNQEGQGADITAYIEYSLDGGDLVSVEMPYFGESGNNDEYRFMFTPEMFDGFSQIEAECIGYDGADDSYYYGGQDQNGNEPPFTYNIVEAIEQDVTVHFYVDMSLETVSGDVKVAGTFTSWGDNPILMELLEGYSSVYHAAVVFPQGSNPYQEYKFINGEVWEYTGNRPLEIDDSETEQELDIVYFNNQNPDDYIINPLSVTINVNTLDSLNAGLVFDSLAVKGSVYPLSWDNFTWLEPIGGSSGTWTVTLEFPEMTYKFVELKFFRNGLDLEADYGMNHNIELKDTGTNEFNLIYGDMEYVGIEENPLTLNNSMIKSHENYPNPVKNSSSIAYELQKASDITVRIYNVNGELVNQYKEGIKEAGKHIVKWNGIGSDGKKLPSGIYFYQINAENQNVSRKMILLK